MKHLRYKRNKHNALINKLCFIRKKPMKYLIIFGIYLIALTNLFAQDSDSTLILKTDRFVKTINEEYIYEPWIISYPAEKKVDSIYLSSSCSDTIVHFIKLTSYFSKRNKIVTERFYYNQGEFVKYCKERSLGDNLQYKISAYYNEDTIIRLEIGKIGHYKFKPKERRKVLQTAKAQFDECTTRLVERKIEDERLNAGWRNPPEANDEGWISYNAANTDSIYLHLKVKANNNAFDSNWMCFEIENNTGREVKTIGKGNYSIQRMQVIKSQRNRQASSWDSLNIENLLTIPVGKTEFCNVLEDFWNNDLGLPKETYNVYMSLNFYLPLENNKSLYARDFRFRFARQKPDEEQFTLLRNRLVDLLRKESITETDANQLYELMKINEVVSAVPIQEFVNAIYKNKNAYWRYVVPYLDKVYYNDSIVLKYFEGIFYINEPQGILEVLKLKNISPKFLREITEYYAVNIENIPVRRKILTWYNSLNLNLPYSFTATYFTKPLLDNYPVLTANPDTLSSKEMDSWIRRRLRCYLWKQWGRRGYRELRKRGISRNLAWNTAKSAHGPWRLSRSPALSIALPGRYFDSLGLPRLHVKSTNQPNRRGT